MKKMLSVVLMLSLACGVLIGCGENNPTGESNAPEESANFVEESVAEDELEMEEVVESAVEEDGGSGAKYEDMFDVWDEEEYMSFYGTVDDCFKYGSSLALYADDTLYSNEILNALQSEGASSVGKWVIGEDMEIIDFDGTILVAKKPDGTLWIYGMTDTNEETGEKELCSMQLECTEENYIYSFHPIASSGAVCISRNESGECIYQYYNILNNEIEQTVPLLCELEDVLYPVKDMYNSFSTLTRVVLSDNTFCNAGTTFEPEEEGVIIRGKITNTLENVDAVFGTDVMIGVLLSFADDNTSLYAYNPTINTKGDTKTVQIPLPEGYTLEDIVSFTSENGIIIEFSDGSFYYGDTSDIYNTEDGGVYALEKIEELDGMAECVVSICCDNFDVIALMDDGYLYEIR